MHNSENLLQQLATKLRDRRASIANADDFMCSAVLVPLMEQDGKLGIWFEVRSAQLNWQPGEICFPGGRIEPADQNPQTAAVRETSEELGVAADSLRVLGPLDCIVSPIGVMLFPYVAHIQTPVKFNPNPSEVAEIFWVPLDWFLSTKPQVATMELATRPLADFPYELLNTYPRDWRRRITYKVLFYQYRQYTIWGLSARVLYNFLTILRELPANKQIADA